VCGREDSTPGVGDKAGFVRGIDQLPFDKRSQTRYAIDKGILRIRLP
jgi:hypothetical protein